jgi:hypothetical protein
MGSSQWPLSDSHNYCIIVQIVTPRKREVQAIYNVSLLTAIIKIEMDLAISEHHNLWELPNCMNSKWIYMVIDLQERPVHSLDTNLKTTVA